MENTIHIIVILFEIYLLIGIIFAIPFVIKGVNKLDSGAKGARWTFRLLILPGALALWPILLRKWLLVRNHGN